MKDAVEARFRADELSAFARDLFRAAGMEMEAAITVSELLVEADLMGHNTHGLQLASSYLDEIKSGGMMARGEPHVVSDRAASVVWDGRRLSGVWLTAHALELASARAREYGTAAVAVRNSHHIGCLAAYLERITRRGQMVMIACSDPSLATVAPAGGIDAVFTPDPLAVGIPTGGVPILIDMSASITTNAMADRLHREGRRFPGAWAQDAAGVATDDPGVMRATPKGSLLPTGGKDHGHKGYGLALTVEALSQGLSGGGRSGGAMGWGASTFLQVYEPEFFAGIGAFRRETDTIVALCHGSRSVDSASSVRLPGERALKHKEASLRDGVTLYPGIMAKLSVWASALGVREPAAIS